MHYISTPRPGTKRVGGAAIVVNTANFSISKLNIAIPHNLEIVLGLMRPKEATGLLFAPFTVHQNQRKKSKLIDHMTLTLQ